MRRRHSASGRHRPDGLVGRRVATAPPVRASLAGMDVGILGGTGPAGQALAARLASVGYDVMVGSRSEEKAAAVCDELRARWPDRRLSLEPATNEGAAKSTLVVVGTQWAAAEPTVAVGGRRPRRQGRHLHGQRPGQGGQGAAAGAPARGIGGGGGAGGRARRPGGGRLPARPGPGAGPARPRHGGRRPHLHRPRRGPGGHVGPGPGHPRPAPAVRPARWPWRARWRRSRPCSCASARPASASPASTPRRWGAVLRHRPGRGARLLAGAGRHHVHVRHHAVRRHPRRPRRHLPALRRPPAPAAGRGLPHPVRAQRHRRRRRPAAQGPRAGRCPTSTWPPGRWPGSTPT